MLISDFEVVCNECGRRKEIPSDSFDVDYAYSERSMGMEVQHIFYGETECRCGNFLSYTITAVEYPVGTHDFSVCESEGCRFVEEPGVKMDYLPELALSVYEEIYQNPDYIYSLALWEFKEFCIPLILNVKNMRKTDQLVFMWFENCMLSWKENE